MWLDDCDCDGIINSDSLYYIQYHEESTIRGITHTVRGFDSNNVKRTIFVGIDKADCISKINEIKNLLNVIESKNKPVLMEDNNVFSSDNPVAEIDNHIPRPEKRPYNRKTV